MKNASKNHWCHRGSLTLAPKAWPTSTDERFSAEGMQGVESKTVFGQSRPGETDSMLEVTKLDPKTVLN